MGTMVECIDTAALTADAVRTSGSPKERKEAAEASPGQLKRIPSTNPLRGGLDQARGRLAVRDAATFFAICYPALSRKPGSTSRLSP